MLLPLQGGLRSTLASLVTSLLFLTVVDSAKLPFKHATFHEKRNVAADLVDRTSTSVHQGFKTVGYYVNWAIYARNFPPQQLQTSALTHVIYAFAGINNKTGECTLTDENADIQKLWPGDVQDNKTTNMYGNLKQLYLHKKRNRNMKTLLSIGGWNLRTNFAPALTNSTRGRRTFARTSVNLLKDLGFDGLDIDWEYPANPADADALVDTCRLFREELDNYARNLTGRPHFLLTLSLPAGPDHFKWFDVPRLVPYVDFMNLMGYDYAGQGFSDYSGHMANVYKSISNPRATNFSTQDAVDYYRANGLPPSKFTLGMPLYGRSFANTAGPGTNFTVGGDGSWEAGVWDYKALPFNDSRIHYDEDIIASWSYGGPGNHSRYMVSYDEPHIARKKAEYIHQNSFGGAMWWETSGDQPLNSSRSLIRTVVDYFDSCGGLEQCDNVLDYPYSKYANLREGMPGQ